MFRCLAPRFLNEVARPVPALICTGTGKTTTSRMNIKRSTAYGRLGGQALAAGGTVLDSVGLTNQATLVSVQYCDFEVAPQKVPILEARSQARDTIEN